MAIFFAILANKKTELTTSKPATLKIKS